VVKRSSISRRRFISGTAAGVAAPYFITRTVAAAQGAADKNTGTATSTTAAGTAANNKINVVLIGANGQGNYNLDQLLKQPDCAIVGVCEVHPERLENTLAKCKKAGHDAKPYHDFREVLANKDVDAVLIATPPHWHAYMCVAAAEAGKDFYCEKPMTLYPGEGLAVLRAVRKHNRITQIGTQIHATRHYRDMVGLVRSGVLGKINVARAFHVNNQGPDGIGNPPIGEPPAGFDVDMWCGPAPKYYHPLLIQDAYYHCSFMRYTGGWTPGMAPHIIDLPFWALDLPVPSMISSSGGRYMLKDCGDAYDTHEVMWQFPNFTLTWTTSLVNSYGFDLQGAPGMERRLGVYFQGVNGTLVTGYKKHKIIPEGDRMSATPEIPKTIPDSVGHHREWLDCIRTRQQPSCNVGYHYKLDLAITLSLLSLKLGRSIEFDPKTETIVGDAEARKLAVPEYRSPWKFPKKYL
jgi:predicted dehydrogenase